MSQDPNLPVEDATHLDLWFLVEQTSDGKFNIPIGNMHGPFGNAFYTSEKEAQQEKILSLLRNKSNSKLHIYKVTWPL